MGKKKRIRTSDLIDDIRRVAHEVGRSPSSVEYAKHGKYAVSTLRSRLGNSWRDIIEKRAGLRYTARVCHRIPTDAEIRRDLERVHFSLGHPPSYTDYKHLGAFNVETVKRRQFGKTWPEVVVAFIEADLEEVKRHQRLTWQYQTTAQWLGRVDELARILGHAPTTYEANQHGINVKTIRNRIGGSWHDVLRAAGVDLNRRSKRRILMSTSTQSLIEDVIIVAQKLGRPPSLREYLCRSKFKSVALSGRLGGWAKVTEQVRISLQTLPSQ
jgi:hypothetical protein